MAPPDSRPRPSSECAARREVRMYTYTLFHIHDTIVCLPVCFCVHVCIHFLRTPSLANYALYCDVMWSHLFCVQFVGMDFSPFSLSAVPKCGRVHSMNLMFPPLLYCSSAEWTHPISSPQVKLSWLSAAVVGSKHGSKIKRHEICISSSSSSSPSPPTRTPSSSATNPDC